MLSFIIHAHGISLYIFKYTLVSFIHTFLSFPYIDSINILLHLYPSIFWYYNKWYFLSSNFNCPLLVYIKIINLYVLCFGYDCLCILSLLSSLRLSPDSHVTCDSFYFFCKIFLSYCTS